MARTSAAGSGSSSSEEMIRAERKALKRGLIAEKARCQDLEQTLAERERTLGASMEEMERLAFDNRRLEKRIEVLMRDLSEKDGGRQGAGLLESSSGGSGGGGLFSGLVSTGSGSFDEISRLSDLCSVLRQELDSKIKENEMVHMRIFEQQQNAKAEKSISETRMAALAKECETNKSEAALRGREIDEIAARLASATLRLDAAESKTSEKERRFRVLQSSLREELRSARARFEEKVPFDDGANPNLARWELRATRVAFRNAVLSMLSSSCAKLVLLASAWKSYASAAGKHGKEDPALGVVARTIDALRLEVSAVADAYKSGKRSAAQSSFGKAMADLVASHAGCLANHPAHKKVHAHVVKFASSIAEYGSAKRKQSGSNEASSKLIETALDSLTSIANAMALGTDWSPGAPTDVASEYTTAVQCRARVAAAIADLHAVLKEAFQEHARAQLVADNEMQWSHKGSMHASRAAIEASKNYMTNLRSVMRPPRIPYHETMKLKHSVDAVNAENKELSNALAARSRNVAKQRKSLQAKDAEIAQLKKKLRERPRSGSDASGGADSPSLNRVRSYSSSKSVASESPAGYEHFVTDFSGTRSPVEGLSQEEAEREDEIKIFYESKIVDLLRKVERMEALTDKSSASKSDLASELANAQERTSRFTARATQLEDELKSTRTSYDAQLKMMTERMCELEADLATRDETVNDLTARLHKAVSASMTSSPARTKPKKKNPFA